MFEIERNINGCDAKDRRALREEQSKPFLDGMHAWPLREPETLSRSSEVLKAINYILRRWEGCARFLHDIAQNKGLLTRAIPDGASIVGTELRSADSTEL
ncbi:Transposase IS66 family protein [Bradyrhizobium sp. Ghvi]|nr:Transposase IS66 family protein [Bradyrhizobium sp. Ghvi]